MLWLIERLYFTRKQMHTGDQKTPEVPIDFFWRHPTRMYSSGKTLGPSGKALVPSSSSFCSLCHLPSMPPLPSVPPAALAAEDVRCMAERPTRKTRKGNYSPLKFTTDLSKLCPVLSFLKSEWFTCPPVGRNTPCQRCKRTYETCSELMDNS